MEEYASQMKDGRIPCKLWGKTFDLVDSSQNFKGYLFINKSINDIEGEQTIKKSFSRIIVFLVVAGLCLSIVASIQHVNGQIQPMFSTQNMNLAVNGNFTAIKIIDNTYGSGNQFEIIPQGYTYIYAVNASYTFTIIPTSDLVTWNFTMANGSFISHSNPVTLIMNSPSVLLVSVSPAPFEIFGIGILSILIIAIIIIITVAIVTLIISKKTKFRRIRNA